MVQILPCCWSRWADAHPATGPWLARSWLAPSWLARSWLARSWLARPWLARSWLARHPARLDHGHSHAAAEPAARRGHQAGHGAPDRRACECRVTPCRQRHLRSEITAVARLG